MQEILQLVDFALKLQRPNTRSKGRPAKRNWMESVENGVTGSKLALPAAAAYCLWKRKEITGEQMIAVVAYVAERLKTVQAVECFPSSPKWIVREALTAMGHPKAATLSVTFEEVTQTAATDGYFLWDGIQRQKAQADEALRKASKAANPPVRTAAEGRATSHLDDLSAVVERVTGML